MKSSSRNAGYLRSWRAVFCPTSASPFLTSSVLLAAAESPREEGHDAGRDLCPGQCWVHAFVSMGRTFPGSGSLCRQGSGAAQDSAVLQAPELCTASSQLWSHTVASQADLPTVQSRLPISSVNLKWELSPLSPEFLCIGKGLWAKIYPETNSYSQMSVGTAPVRKGPGISASRRDGFTSTTLCLQSC